jgi:two-component system response regulator YesN
MSKTENSEFINKIINIAKHYTIATGAGCRVMDTSGQEIYNAYGESVGCRFCELVRSATNEKQDCANLHYENAHQAQQFNGSFIYTCPSNFVFWASPVVIKGKIVASIMAGSTLLKSAEEYLTDDYIHRFDIKETPEIRRRLKAIMQTSDQRIASLVELLIMLCRSLEDESFQSGVETYSLRDTLALAHHNSENAPYTTELEAQLLQVVSEGDDEKAKEILTAMVNSIFDDRDAAGNIYEKRNKALRLAVLLAYTALENGAASDNVLNINLSCLKNLQQQHTIEDIHHWLEDMIKAFCDSVFQFKHLKHGEFLARAIRYIHRHFSENISLEEVAAEASLSPSYFSRIFKNEMKMSFTEYLNRVRIDESKRLLRNSSESLSEIASRCGFSDQSYYTKIFKKSLNISPGKFRSMSS